MKKYKIGIEETLVQEFEVEAKNFNEALNIAKDNYNNGEFVLSPGEAQCKKIAVTYPNSQCSEWEEF